MSNNLPLGYDERYVLFADVLGFQHIVETIESGTLQGQQVLQRIYNASMRVQADAYRTNLTSSMQSDQPRCVMFSDCMVVSTTNNSNGLLGILNRALGWQMMLMAEGIFVRGGITRGLIWQDDGVLMGSGLNTACKMERELAIYPRVLIGEEMYEDIEKITDDLQKRLLKQLCIRGDDGLYMLTPFHPALATDGQTSGAPHVEVYLRRVAEFIRIAALENGNNPKVMSKYSWLSTQLIEVQEFWCREGSQKEIVPILN